jgi:hypothetical protein
MTALIRSMVPARRNIAFAAVALLGACVGSTTIRIDQVIGSTATVMIPPAAAASLIAATSGGELAHNRAIGDHAKLINAAMPFSTAPITASPPPGAALHDPGGLL